MPAARAAVSRADLLLALAAAGADSLAALRMAAMLQFTPKPPAAQPLYDWAHDPSTASRADPAGQAEAIAGATLTSPGAVLSAPLLAVIARRPPVTSDAGADALATPNAPPQPPDLSPRLPGAIAPWTPLVRPTRLWPALKSALTVSRAAGIDWPALQRQLALAEVPLRLPQIQRQLWGGTLWVVVDMAEPLRPYRDDFKQALRLVARLRGRAGLVVWGVIGRPDQLGAIPEAMRPRHPHASRVPVPPPGTTVLLLSDCGVLSPYAQGLAALATGAGAPTEPAPPDSPSQDAWVGFARQLRQAGCTAVAWVPLNPGQVPQALAQAATVHCLGAGTGMAALKPQRGRRTSAARHLAELQRLAELLPRLRTAAACCVWLAPALLRDLRLALPSIRAEPALESLYWSDAGQVGSSLVSRPLLPTAAAAQRIQLASLPVADRLAVLTTLARHHGGLWRSTEAMEATLFAAHAGLSAADLRAHNPELADLVQQSQAWVQALAHSVAHPQAAAAGPAEFTASYARDLLGRQSADTVWQAAQAAEVAALWAITSQTQAPAGVDAALLLQARQRVQRLPARQWHLIQRGDALWLWPAAVDLPRYASMVEADRRTAGVILRGGAAGARWVAASDSALRGGLLLLDTLASSGAVNLTLDDGELVLALRKRPAWATEWGRDPQGLYALAPSPQGGAVKLTDGPGEGWFFSDVLLDLAQREPGHQPGSPEPMPDRGHPNQRAARTKVVKRSGSSGTYRPLPTLRIQLHVAAKADDPHGLRADLQVTHDEGDFVAQTLRYIPPGDFFMGSREDEPGRDSDESPRHRVRLSQGFWLADTACTQALWRAVMGDNPSRFEGDFQRPVETVSFDDVQLFLSRLQALLPPGCEAVLPTEAQWEYACRAGSDTTFNTGATLSREQANFDAADDTPLAPRGEESKDTVPVKSLPPNAWGLFEMHGNVWEWCDDYDRNYADTDVADGVVVDPAGQRGSGPEARRAVRGGSWIFLAGLARSACRFRFQRGVRLLDLGFRFALRSTSPDLAEPGPAGQVLVSGPAGRQGFDPEGQDAPLADRRDADPPRLRDRLPEGLGGKPKPPKKPGKKR